MINCHCLFIDMNIKRVFLLILMIGLAHCFLTSKFNKIKERAKQYYRANFGLNKTWQYLNGDPSLYPGTNIKYKQENMRKWEIYYYCLREQEKSIGKHGSLIPEAIQGFEGGLVKFDCDLCLNPAEQSNIDSIEWYFGKFGNNYLEIIVYDEHLMLTPEDRALHIYNLKVDHSGQYVCILGDSITVPYYLTVVNGSTQLSEVHSEAAKLGPYASQPAKIPEYNLILDTVWSEWSTCSRCEEIGRRHKLGYCVVLYDADNNATRHQRDFGTLKKLLLHPDYEFSLKKAHTRKEKMNTTVLPVHIELIKIFEFGIPCKSHILPESIKSLAIIQARKDEIMTGFCKVECKGQDIFELRDKDGNVIERANNSAGIYSTLQGVPPITPSVERRLQYEIVGKDIVLTCPGNLNSDVSIKWQINSKNIIPELIHDLSNGRIYVTLLDRIHIKKAMEEDSNFYSCWQNNELAGTISLVVEKKIQMTFNHYLMLIGMILILSTFCYVFIRAFIGRKHAKRART